MQALQFLMKQYLASTPQELIRLLISREHTRLTEDALRYGKSATIGIVKGKKAAIEELREKFRTESPEVLTAYLKEVGYIQMQDLDPEIPNSKRVKIWRVDVHEKTREKIIIEEHYEDVSMQKMTYSRSVFMSAEEIIRDMKKEKFI